MISLLFGEGSLFRDDRSTRTSLGWELNVAVHEGASLGPPRMHPDGITPVGPCLSLAAHASQTLPRPGRQMRPDDSYSVDLESTLVWAVEGPSDEDLYLNGGLYLGTVGERESRLVLLDPDVLQTAELVAAPSLALWALKGGGFRLAGDYHVTPVARSHGAAFDVGEPSVALVANAEADVHALQAPALTRLSSRAAEKAGRTDILFLPPSEKPPTR